MAGMMEDADYLIAQLEATLTRVRNDEVVGVVCVLVLPDGMMQPFWATTETCIHGGAMLRAAAAYLVAKMDTHALRRVVETEEDEALH